MPGPTCSATPPRVRPLRLVSALSHLSASRPPSPRPRLRVRHAAVAGRPRDLRPAARGGRRHLLQLQPAVQGEHPPPLPPPSALPIASLGPGRPRGTRPQHLPGGVSCGVLAVTGAASGGGGGWAGEDGFRVLSFHSDAATEGEKAAAATVRRESAGLLAAAFWQPPRCASADAQACLGALRLRPWCPRLGV